MSDVQISSDIQTAINLIRRFEKDAVAVKDYGFDLAPGRPWQPWLEPGEYVTTLTVTPDDGLTLVQQSIAANARGVRASVIVGWLSGGVAGVTYDVRYVFSTNKGRTDVFTLQITVT